MKNLRTRALIYGLALTAGAAYASSPYRVGVVTGISMSPAMHHGEFYLLDEGSYRADAPQRGDVVVFRRSGEALVKRVLAVAGDRVLITRRESEAGDALVYSFQYRALSLLQQSSLGKVHLTERRVPAGYSYVVGDNLDYSQDSRQFGFVPNEDILGRVVEAPDQPYRTQQVKTSSGHRALVLDRPPVDFPPAEP